MPRLPLLLSIAALCFLLDFGAHAAEGTWQTAANGVASAIADAEAAFAKGDPAAAKKAINDAYFRKFEDSRMEIAVRKEIGVKRAAEVEGMFGDMRKAVTAGDKSAVARIAAELKQALATDAKALDAAKVAVPQ